MLPAKATSPTSRVLAFTLLWRRNAVDAIRRRRSPPAIQSPLSISERPDGPVRISAARHTPARSLVRLWAMVTRGVGRQEQIGHRLADDIGPADDDRALKPRQIATVHALDQQHRALRVSRVRRRWPFRRLPSVPTFIESGPVEHPCSGAMSELPCPNPMLVGERSCTRCHESNLPVEIVDQLQQRVLRGIGMQFVLDGMEAAFLALRDLEET